MGRHSARARTLAGGTGLAVLAIATLSAGHAAAGPPHHRAAPLAATRPAYGTIVVGDGDSIEVFAPGAKGNATPIRVITGPATGIGYVYGVDLDRFGNIWAADYSSNLLEEFAANANGNAAPMRTIEDSGSDIIDPEGVALNPAHHVVWTASFNSDTVVAFSDTANGVVAPVHRVAGDNPGISYSYDVAVSGNGKHVWQADGGNGSLHEYSTTGPTNQSPQRVIQLAAGDSPRGVALDRFGNVWASDYEGKAIVAFGPHSDTVPTRTITGVNTGLDQPQFLSLDATGRPWIALGGNSGTGLHGVEEFGPAAHGNANPIRQITGPATGLTNPEDVAVFSAAPTAPRSLKARGGVRKITLSWRRPASRGGGLLGYAVRRKTSKHGKWQTIAGVGTPRFTDTHRQPGHTYRYEVTAVNERGDSAPTKPVTAAAHGKRHHT